jgi:hypothetical protein
MKSMSEPGAAAEFIEAWREHDAARGSAAGKAAILTAATRQHGNVKTLLYWRRSRSGPHCHWCNLADYVREVRTLRAAARGIRRSEA